MLIFIYVLWPHWINLLIYVIALCLKNITCMIESKSWNHWVNCYCVDIFWYYDWHEKQDISVSFFVDAIRVSKSWQGWSKKHSYLVFLPLYDECTALSTVYYLWLIHVWTVWMTSCSTVQQFFNFKQKLY